MIKEKQIEEMAELERLLRIRRMDIEKQGCDIFALIKNNTSEEQAIADYLTGAGYRLASEVAREIFEEIDRILGGLMVEYVDYKRFSEADTIRYAIYYLLGELKKKYTEGEG